MADDSWEGGQFVETQLQSLQTAEFAAEQVIGQ